MCDLRSSHLLLLLPCATRWHSNMGAYNGACDQHWARVFDVVVSFEDLKKLTGILHSAHARTGKESPARRIEPHCFLASWKDSSVFEDIDLQQRWHAPSQWCLPLLERLTLTHTQSVEGP